VEHDTDNRWSSKWAHEGKQPVREEQMVEEEQRKAKVEKQVAEETN
jgi:hypothetical protein